MPLAIGAMGVDDRWTAAPSRQGRADDAWAHAVTYQGWREIKLIPATPASSSRCAGTAVAQQWRGGEWSESSARAWDITTENHGWVLAHNYKSWTRNDIADALSPRSDVLVDLIELNL